jgi:hypothetical protein
LRRAAAGRTLASFEPLTALHAPPALEPLGFGFAGIRLDRNGRDLGRVPRGQEQRHGPDRECSGDQGQCHEMRRMRLSIT